MAPIAKVTRDGTIKQNPARQALVVLSHHRNARADEALEEMARRRTPAVCKRGGPVWIGQGRGERGAGLLGPVIDAIRTDIR